MAVAVITVSDTRTLETDGGGSLICDLLIKDGHRVVSRHLVKDDVDEIQSAIRSAQDAEQARAILVTGGTGIAPRDVTTEAVEPMLDRVLGGYGELFRWLSYEQIGSAAMLSRACGGVAGNTILLTMPGSVKGVELAMTRLILPELTHLTEHLGN